MQPNQNPQGNNQPNPGQPQYPQPAQPQQYAPPEPGVAEPMMEPFDQHTNTTPPAYPTAPQQQPQQPQQQYSPVQSTGAQPLHPYTQQFEQKDVVDNNPYDFFLNSTDGKKAKKASGSGASIGMGKIVLVVGAMVAVIGIAAAVLISSTKGADPSPALATIAKDQQQIIYVTTAGSKVLESQSLQNFAATAQYSTTSAQNQYVEYLNKIGVKLDAKDLTALKFPEVDTVLTAAQTASTYDAAFKSEMQVILAEYVEKLNKSKSASQTRAQVDILNKNIAAATLLQQQLGT